MRKSGLLIIIATIFLLGIIIAGCAQKGSPNQGGSSTTAKEGANEILIGHSTSLSGDGAAWGQQEKMGVEVTLEKINRDGGLLGKQVKVITLDDRGDKVEVVNTVRKLITQNKAVALIGHGMSSLCLAMAPIVEELKVPAVSTMGIHPAVTVPEPGKVRPYFFRVSYIATTEGSALADAVTKRGYKQAAVIYDLSQDYSMSLKDAFKQQYLANGGQVVAEETIKGGEEDFRSIITRLKDKSADVIVLPIYYKEGALIIKQARELGIKLPFAGGGGLESDVFTQIGGAAVEGTLVVTHFSPDDPSPIVQEFRNSFKQKFNMEPDANAATAHDALVLIADAIKRAGNAEPKAIRDALETAKDVPGVTGTLTIDPATHNPKTDAFLLEVKNGKLSFVERIKSKS